MEQDKQGRARYVSNFLMKEFLKPNVILDDPATLAAAQEDPLGFLEDLHAHAVLDEIQRAPELFLSIKKLVDQNCKGRRFILTGSADVMTLPKVADSLAGRIEVHNLWPLSQGEIIGKESNFLKTLVSKEGKFQHNKSSWKDIIQAIRTGGYPEAVQRKTETRRSKWFESYIKGWNFTLISFPHVVSVSYLC